MTASTTLVARARLVALAGPALVTVIALARWTVRHPDGGHAHVVLAEELALAAGAPLLVVLALWARLPATRDRLLHVLVALGMIEIMSAALARNTLVALRASTLLADGVALFLVGRACARAAGRSAVPLAALLVPIALVAGSVVLEATGQLHAWSPPGHAPGGILGQRNVASALLVCAAPAVAHVALRGESSWTRGVACSVAGLAACAVVMTRTRSAWITATVLAALGVYLALRADDRTRSRAAPLLVTLAIGTATAPLLPTVLAWSSPHPYRETLRHLVDPSSASGAGRLVQYATTLRMAAARPLLGVGPGNWAGQYLSFARPGDPTVTEGFWPTNRLASSDALAFLAERGLPALALAAFAVTLACGRGERAWLRRATLMAALTAGAFDAVLQTPCAMGLFAWVMGAASTGAPEEVELSTRPARSVRAVALAFAAVLTAFAGLAACRLASFVVSARARSIEDLERAARLDPGDVALRLTLAEHWISAERCGRARPHLAAAIGYCPSSPAARELSQRCSER